jgi:hypothetical protein
MLAQLLHAAKNSNQTKAKHVGSIKENYKQKKKKKTNKFRGP